MRLISNKKGTVFHYALLGLFASLGIAFLFFNQSVGLETFILGQWESNFAQHYTYEGEKVQLQEDINMDYYISLAINETALNGGYAQDSFEDIGCGQAFELSLMNSGEEFCFAQINQEISSQFASIVEQQSQDFKDGFEINVENNKLNFLSENGIKIIPGDASFDISEEEFACLEQGNVPFFSGEEYDQCKSCPDVDCSRYIDQFYCDLDPCKLGCVSFYTNLGGTNEYYSCGACPDEAECSNYINQYYCEVDVCSLGCKWNVNKCEDSETRINGEDIDAMNILDKAKIVSNPEIYTQNTQYTIDYSFSYDLGVYYEDYQQVAIEAMTLLGACQNTENLEECLEDERKDNWEYGSCGSDDLYQEDSRKVPFCVSSPNELQLTSLISNSHDLKYQFALDFFPTEALFVEATEVTYDSMLNAYKVYFTESESAIKYKIYITDYANLDYIGTASQFRIQRFGSELFENKEIDIIEIETDSCPIGDGHGEIGVAYDCAGEILYIYDAENLILGEDYYFAATSLNDDSESQIYGFVYI